MQQSNSIVNALTIGRGYEVYPDPVTLEPSIDPLIFDKRIDTERPAIDDGRYPGLLDRFWARSRRRPDLARFRTPVETTHQNPASAIPVNFAELRLLLQRKQTVIPEVNQRVLLSLANRSTACSFEIIANSVDISTQFAVREQDAAYAAKQLEDQFGACSVKRVDGHLASVLAGPSERNGRISAELVLKNNLLYQLSCPRSYDPDPLIPLFSGLSRLENDESFVLQILFQAVTHPWSRLIRESLVDVRGGPRFVESRELDAEAKRKFAYPLLATMIRLTVHANDRKRAWQILRGVASAVRGSSSANSNELVPVEIATTEGPGLPLSDVLARTSRRSGMLLNVAEVSAIAHPPSMSVAVDRVRRELGESKLAPSLSLGHSLVLGENSDKGQERMVSLSTEQRVRHIHLIGSSGSGKSTLIYNMILQDLDADQGFCLIDPHGDLVDQIVGSIPEHRRSDVILFDPSDTEFPVGLNILQAHSDLEKTILASDLTAGFKRMSTSWGDVMDSVLANAILAFLESTRGGTLLELKRFLIEKAFRQDFLRSITDEGIRYFWEHEFPLLANKPQASILIRLDTFLRQKLVRNIVCQRETKLNFRKIMDQRKVLLVKLSQGLIGEENACLLGTLLISKIYQAALSRQNTAVRPPFWLYLDEFHNFITPSLEGVLSGARKYNIGLVLAHQEFRQLQSRNPDVASSVLSNCYTRVCFRLGDTDAEKLASGFSFFTANSLQNLGIGEAIGRIERADYDFNLKTAWADPPAASEIEASRRQVIENVRSNYSRRKEDVEAELGVPLPTPQNGQEAILTSTVEPSTATSEEIENQGASVQGQTPSGKEPVAMVTSTIGASSDRGNSQHRYLQGLIKRLAEERGFRATVEKEVFGGAGRIDVALENDEQRIACEVSVTNDADYELQNILKCRSAGYSPVLVISDRKKHLNSIRRKASNHLKKSDLDQIHFFSAEEFFSWLDANSLRPEKIETVKGFKVRVSVKPPSQSEETTRKRAISEVLAGALKRLRNKKDRT